MNFWFCRYRVSVAWDGWRHVLLIDFGGKATCLNTFKLLSHHTFWHQWDNRSFLFASSKSKPLLRSIKWWAKLGGPHIWGLSITLAAKSIQHCPYCVEIVILHVKLNMRNSATSTYVIFIHTKHNSNAKHINYQISKSAIFCKYCLEVGERISEVNK